MRELVSRIDHKKLEKFITWLISMIGYSFILILLSIIFPNNIQIDNGFYGIWGFVIAISIYILNKTVKPILFSLTLPITALTLGIFYPCINAIILKIVDIILGNHLQIKGFLMIIVIALLISVLDIILEKMILQPMIKGEKK